MNGIVERRLSGLAVYTFFPKPRIPSAVYAPGGAVIFPPRFPNMAARLLQKIEFLNMLQLLVYSSSSVAISASL